MNPPDTQQLQTLAFKLLNALYDERVYYSFDYECWTYLEPGKEYASLPLDYSSVKELANSRLEQLTREKPTPQLVKAVLIQIEQWMLRSGGKLAQIEWDSGQRSWCPNVSVP